MTYECNDALSNLLTDLRANQREFFRTKKHGFLHESKRLERELDKFLQERKAPKPVNIDLFNQ